jgi:hypothetical protein
MMLHRQLLVRGRYDVWASVFAHAKHIVKIFPLRHQSLDFQMAIAEFNFSDEKVPSVQSRSGAAPR